MLVTFGSREVRPDVVPTGRIVDLAFASLRDVLTDRVTRRIFVIFGISFVAIQMSRPYIPVLVEGIVGLGPGLASSIGLVVGTAALVGALVSPLGGVLGDRIGFRPVLVAALVGAGVVLFLMPLVASVGALALLAVVLGAATAAVSSMIFGLLATELPAERRSAALNLVYLPLYAAGIIGPAVGAVVASVSGVDALFVVGGLVFLFAAATFLRPSWRDSRTTDRRGPRGARNAAPGASPDRQPGRRRDTTNAASKQRHERAAGQGERLARLDEPVALAGHDHRHHRVPRVAVLVVRVLAAEVAVVDEGPVRQHELLVDVAGRPALPAVAVHVHRDRDGLGSQDPLVDGLATGEPDRRDDRREDDRRAGRAPRSPRRRPPPRR